MKGLIISFFLIFCFTAFCQKKDDMLFASHMDIIKNDYDRYFQKVQTGVEGNYFFSQKFAATAGLEIWSREGASGVIGGRWYPNADAFIRVRGLIGAVDDVSLGGGWAKPISETLRFETMADFYFNGTFAIRAGFALFVK